VCVVGSYSNVHASLHDAPLKLASSLAGTESKSGGVNVRWWRTSLLLFFRSLPFSLIQKVEAF